MNWKKRYEKTNKNLKIGDTVKVVRETNNCTNHSNRTIGTVFKITNIDYNLPTGHSEEFSIDAYVTGDDISGAINNRDLEFVK